MDTVAPCSARPTAATPGAPTSVPGPLVAAAALPLLAACGGGAALDPPPDPPDPPALSRSQAARFLAQASLRCQALDIEQVQTLGCSGWLEAQFALPRSSGHVEWLQSKGYDAAENRNGQAGSNNMLWRKLLASPDPLRQRMTLALSEILVISVSGLSGIPFKSFAAAAYMDILERHAFGSFRSLLDEVSRSAAMGAYLSFRGNKKANPATGSQPDENYAREVMQLFTIGLVELDIDGTPRLVDAAVQETYSQDDVSQLARVFTGWDLDTSVGSNDTPDRVIRPMVQVPSRHESGSKAFLGVTIPAGTSGEESLRIALDTLVAHPNAGPFIGRQLIQRWVTGHPSSAYVARVAAVFNDNGSGAKGDLKAVLRAILLDDDARSERSRLDPQFGKLREPMLRFVQWARTFDAASPDDSWAVGDLSDPAKRLGQSPLRSSSVFNFYRPGYVPPNSAFADLGLTAPEFQITTETSVAGYLNFMQKVVAGGSNGIVPDYTQWLPLSADTQALLDELNLLLAAGEIPADTLVGLKSALDSIAVGSRNWQQNRLYAALTLVLAAPETLSQR